MNNYQQITKSPEALGAFLRSLPVVEGPWDAEFQARFCAGCPAENCDACPHGAARNNPGWWLGLDAGAVAFPPQEGTVLDLTDEESGLCSQEEAERMKKMFRYAIESGIDDQTVRIVPMDESGTITLFGTTDIQFFINRLLDCTRKA